MAMGKGGKCGAKLTSPAKQMKEMVKGGKKSTKK